MRCRWIYCDSQPDGVNFYENNRCIVFSTIDRVAESDPTGFHLQTLATGGYEFKKGNWSVGPGYDSGLIDVNLIGISRELPISFTMQYNAEFIPGDFIVNNVYVGFRINFWFV